MKTLNQLRSIRDQSRYKKIILHESELGVEPNDGPCSPIVRSKFDRKHAERVIGAIAIKKHLGHLDDEKRADMIRWAETPVEPFKPIKVVVPKRKRTSAFNPFQYLP